MSECFDGYLRFEGFELDLRDRALRCAGARIPIQQQPFRLLSFLAMHAKQIVQRDVLKKHLWDEHTYVDYEAGLNYCVREIRKALGDDKRHPRFLQTMTRHGYEFLAEVERVSRELEEPSPVQGRRSITVTLGPDSDFLKDEGRMAGLAQSIAKLLVSSYGGGKEAWQIECKGHDGTMRKLDLGAAAQMLPIAATSVVGPVSGVNPDRSAGKYLAVLVVE